MIYNIRRVLNHTYQLSLGSEVGIRIHIRPTPTIIKSKTSWSNDMTSIQILTIDILLSGLQMERCDRRICSKALRKTSFLGTLPNLFDVCMILYIQYVSFIFTRTRKWFITLKVHNYNVHPQFKEYINEKQHWNVSLYKHISNTHILSCLEALLW